MKVPSVVLYTAFGRSLPAIVLAARIGEVSHLGSDGEPLLTLLVVDPGRETGLAKDKEGNPIYPVGRLPQSYIEHDVVHESHEFDAEFLKQHGSSPAQIAAQRGHGEWTEYVDDPELRNVLDGLRGSLRSANRALMGANREAADLRGTVDILNGKLAQYEANKVAEVPKTTVATPIDTGAPGTTGTAV